MSRRGRLTLVPVGTAAIASEAADELARYLGKQLDLEVTVEEATLLSGVVPDDREGGRSAELKHGGRRAATDLPPISSNDLMDALADQFQADDAGWVLGITAHDLTAPGRSCVFGEATLGGRWAIVSLARLGPPDALSPRSLERIYREALHELGHLAGLGHCEGRTGCVMESSATVAAIDARNSEFCPSCIRRFRAETG